jgi:hypothetical protein
MKKASDIINLLQNKPQFSKLSSFSCIEKIKSAFSSPLQKMVKFAYIKNETLFFVLNHPGAKQEFDNNIDSIKSALKFVKPQECDGVIINDIKAFVTHKPLQKPQYNPKKIYHYHERATGEFDLSIIKDEKLRSVVASIQEIIKANQK